MPKLSIEQVKKISPKVLLKLINRIKQKLQHDPTFMDMCKEYNVHPSIINVIPMKFGDIPVSARTENAIITLNYKLLTDGDVMADAHYGLHECLHYLQQCFGDRPTQNADVGDYINNDSENEAFQYQLQYLDDHYGEDEADRYADHLLDHHDKKGKERKDLKEELLSKVDNDTR